MPCRPAIARERLAQLLHLSAAAIAHELGCTPDHINVLLRLARAHLCAGRAAWNTKLSDKRPTTTLTQVGLHKQEI